MTIDSEIREAIKQATKEAGQEGTVADRIIAWFSALTSGNENLEDRESVHRHMDLLLKAIRADIQETENEQA